MENLSLDRMTKAQLAALARELMAREAIDRDVVKRARQAILDLEQERAKRHAAETALAAERAKPAREVVRTVEMVREVRVPFETVRVVEMPVEVVREVPVVRHVTDLGAAARIADLEAQIAAMPPAEDIRAAREWRKMMEAMHARNQ
jgi:hypothetical protein